MLMTNIEISDNYRNIISLYDRSEMYIRGCPVLFSKWLMKPQLPIVHGNNNNAWTTLYVPHSLIIQNQYPWHWGMVGC